MMRLMILILLIAIPVMAVGSPRILDQYIDEALENNLTLKQREFSYEKARAELAEARGLFLPSVSISSRYSRAGGGRSVDVPVGDLVNPIHEALNQILGEPAFPTNLPNVSTPFLREEEQETKLQVAQPLFQPSVYFKYKIRSRLRSAERAARDAYAQELAKEVKVAYFNYLKTLRVVELYERTEELLRENLRVSTSLFENGKATQDVVFRAKAELSELEQEQVQAETTRDLARSYFNLLLNRSLDEPIEVEDLEPVPTAITESLAECQTLALGNRLEVQQLELGIDAAENHVSLEKSAFLPDVVFALDYGFQGETYRFTEADDFWMGSVVLKWNIFDGLQREAKIGQAKAASRVLEAQLAELKEAIKLQVREAYANVAVAGKSLAAARDRVTSAEKSFEIVSRKYGEGMAAQIEYLDARTTVTQARVNLVVTTYDYHIRLAELEWATATYPVRSELE